MFSYKVKTDSEGNETQCKARLNCDDRYQSESTYSETFAPTSTFTNIRAMCALTTQEDTVFQTARCFVFARCCTDSRIQHLLGTSTLLNG